MKIISLIKALLLVLSFSFGALLPFVSATAAPAATQGITPQEDQRRLALVVEWVDDRSKLSQSALDAFVIFSDFYAVESKKYSGDKPANTPLSSALDTELKRAILAITAARSGLERLPTTDQDIAYTHFPQGYSESLRAASLNQCERLLSILSQMETLALAIDTNEPELIAEFDALVDEGALELIISQRNGAASTLITVPKTNSNYFGISTLGITYDAMIISTRGFLANKRKQNYTTSGDKFRQFANDIRNNNAAAKSALSLEKNKFDTIFANSNTDAKLTANLKKALVVQQEWLDYTLTLPAMFDAIATKIDDKDFVADQWDQILTDLVVIEDKYVMFQARKVAAVQGK